MPKEGSIGYVGLRKTVKGLKESKVSDRGDRRRIIKEKLKSLHVTNYFNKCFETEKGDKYYIDGNGVIHRDGNGAIHGPDVSGAEVAWVVGMPNDRPDTELREVLIPKSWHHMEEVIIPYITLNGTPLGVGVKPFMVFKLMPMGVPPGILMSRLTKDPYIRQK